MDGVLDVVRREVPRFVGAGAGGPAFGLGPVPRQPPPQHQPRPPFQQQQPRPSGRQPLPPQGSPSVRPQAGNSAQQQRNAGKQDKPRATATKSSTSADVKPKVRDDGDGKKPSSSLMVSLYQTYEVLFDGQLSRKPVFDVTSPDGCESCSPSPFR